MSGIEEHLARLTGEGQITLRDIADQIIANAVVNGRDLIGRDWRASRVDGLTGPMWQFETAHFDEEAEENLWAGPRLTDSELAVRVMDRLIEGNVWTAEVIK